MVSSCVLPVKVWHTLRWLSKHLVEQVVHVVDQLVTQTALAPLLELDLLAMRQILFEDRLEPLRRRGIPDPERELVVDFERTIVEIARSDRAPDAIHAHHLLMQERVRVLEQAHAAPKQLLEVAMPRVLHHWVVR